MQVILTEAEYNELKSAADAKAPRSLADEVLRAFRKEFGVTLARVTERHPFFETEGCVLMGRLVKAMNEAQLQTLAKYYDDKPAASS